MMTLTKPPTTPATTSAGASALAPLISQFRAAQSRATEAALAGNLLVPIYSACTEEERRVYAILADAARDQHLDGFCLLDLADSIGNALQGFVLGHVPLTDVAALVGLFDSATAALCAEGAAAYPSSESA